MKLLFGFIKNLYIEKRGASSIEYAIIVALIAVVIIGALVIVGAAVMRMFEFEFPSLP